ncbi:MAG TPA: hypothetical protein VGH27_01000 [Streptosporangiaceae bacterium]|jgi:hypothetical protein
MVGTGRLMLTGALTACVVLGLAQGAQAGAAPQITTLSWHIQSPPNPSGSIGDDLSDVSCSSANACTAVGSYESSSGGQGIFTTFADQWNGSTWTIQNTPEATSSNLNGVTCLSATDCVAVGDILTGVNINLDTLAEVWNGSTWTVQPTPTPKGATRAFLSAVDCTSSSNCLAVGDYSGKNGRDQFLLAERWNGTSWKLSGTQTPSGSTSTDLNAVSCASARSCIAVGSTNASSDNMLAETWSGAGWTLMSTPSPSNGGGLTGVSCPAVNSCTASGGYYNGSADVTLAEHWDGTSWTQQTTPNPKGSTVTQLTDVSCASTTRCVATGSQYKMHIPSSLSEVATGSSWSVKQPGSPSGSIESVLSSVSCPTTSDCTAVGFWENSSGTTFLLAAQYN